MNTFAPLSSASWMVGSDARMRASLVTLPPSTGTFRSSRIRTRLPARSWSAMRSTFMATRLTEAFDQAIVVSSMRFEKPHSLSYQRADLDQRAFGDARERRVVGGRSRIVVVVDRDELLVGVREHALHGAVGGFLHDLVDLFHGRGALGDEREVDQRDVDGRNADREAIELALEFRQHQAHGRGARRSSPGSSTSWPNARDGCPRDRRRSDADRWCTHGSSSSGR